MKSTVLTLQAVASLSAISVLLGFLGKWHYLLDMCSHFRLQATCAMLSCGILLFVLNRLRWALGCLILGLGLLATLAKYYGSEPEVNSSTFRLLTLNVLTMNPRHDRVVRYILEADPDVITLMEVDSSWDKTLESALRSRWPYHKSVPRADNFGIAIYSKLPWESCDVVEYESARITPSLSATFQIPEGGELRLIATHPLSPMNDLNWQSRNSLLADLAQDVRSRKSENTIVAGDLNCTPWSYWFQNLLIESGLRDTSEERGLHITWLPIPILLLGLPLDHVLVGPNIQVAQSEVGPYVGSDHRAVIVDFNIATKRPEQSDVSDRTGL